MDTVTITMNGRELEVQKGRTVLEAALGNGISVPYYCFHPGLGVDGSCRVCIVRIEKMPKLQTACSTVCTDGMVVHTESPDVVEARAGVFEFLLINHPLDCPVCDKGGECPLQDFSYGFGPARSRMEFPRRVFDGEGVEADIDFGPTLMLNRNRCILCTRCVRFMRDVDGDAQIGITDRGAGSEIATYKEEGVHSLLSGNLMDVCPVGAITTRDYRFKSRPWDNPLAVDTICTFCSKGCNTTVWIKAKPEWAKGPALVRVTPRYTPEVNGYWMCDIGRFDYHWVEGDQRLAQPLMGAEAGGLREALRPASPELHAAAGGQQTVTWQDLFRKLLARLEEGGPSGLRFVTSAHASLEELFLLRRIATHVVPGLGSLAIEVSWRHRPKTQPEHAQFKVPPADAPNINGARDLGLQVRGDNTSGPDLSALRAAVEAGAIHALYVLDSGPAGSLGDVSWILRARAAGVLPLLIVQGVLQSELTAAADFVLPGATAFEKDASYTNDQGRVQGAAQVNPPPGDALDDSVILSHLALALGVPPRSIAQIRHEIADALQQHPAYAALPEMTFARPVAARTWLQESNPSERWKWDVLFQDVPPLKFAETVKKID